MSWRVVAVVGPTAAGKSAASLAIAHALGAEIVNADAMALYRGLDIGTAKLPEAEREGVVHHVLDIWDVRERASVADFQHRAVEAVNRLLAAGTPVVVTGGSGLYVQALIDDLRIPPTDARVRADLEDELALVGPTALHEKLAVLDPAAAQAILPTNGRRLVRALEVVALTGSFTATLPTGDRRWPQTRVVGLDRADLDDRIALRVSAMFEDGLVAEALALPDLPASPTASKALGYAQVLAHPDDPARAAQETFVATRRFARRQRSWFRRDSTVRWVTSVDEALAIVRA
ncbi:MAG TPA: tRNA (adenosine(37)-N6)-dimethylallyltransferase MiaA [Mycobacteriales bacterium]